MSLRTTNAYGAIIVTDDVVACLAGRLAMDCYGVVDRVPRKFSDALADLFRRNNDDSGVRVTTKGDRVFIDIYVILRMGLNIQAVADSLKSTIKYGVESFTGMIVDTVNIHVVGVRL